ncbi:mannitol dehydrogenase family protein [Sphingomonas qilianensis]|uniref:Mannitol dehydrogenase family protein n=1 Tax=Sphingomonas qilianensis TaxID=1736690 RepID=A0ABU9XUM0_9SPHN
MNLCHTTLDRLPDTVIAPRHVPPVATGIVHFGPGAFHRAHQASYIDTVLDTDPRWAIAAVALRSAGTVAALAAQDGLYTLAIRDAASSLRVIAAHSCFIGPDGARQTHALLADPAVRLVTSTVTEKGYCLAVDGTLDLAHPDILHDLAGTDAPRSLVGWLVAGLAARRAAGHAPFVPMPCDNLAGNGAKLHAALVAFAATRDAGLGDWIAGEVRVPATMVDSITPASDAALLAQVASALGMADAAPVQRESFTQWVIEDIGRPLGPDLAAAGAIVTPDVGGFERAKLRILNGAHSTLAYAGLLRGRSSVAEAMADPELAALVDRMIRDDIIPMLPPVAGLDLDAYRQSVLQRFANPVIVHRLDQIAQDGSQKMPYRLGDTLRDNRRAGRMPQGVIAALGGWIAFLIQRSRDGAPIIDPSATALIAAASAGTPRAVIERLAGAELGLSRDLREDAAVLETLERAVSAMLSGDVRGALAAT